MLSVVIITKNEQANIRKCLESVQWTDEIIVLDSGSSDLTVDIAKEFTPHVYINEDWQGYGIQKQRALDYASKSWVLNIDADEVVDESLKQALCDAIKANDADAYRIPICMSFYGKALRYSCSPKRHIRLFKRDKAHYSDDIVHEKILLDANCRIKKLTQPLLHNSFQDMQHALYKMNKYSSYSAKIRLDNKRNVSFSRSLLNSSWMFIRCYFLQKGFLDGKAGFVMAFLNAEGAFYRGIKQVFPDKQL